jgi:hypothetical protein
LRLFAGGDQADLADRGVMVADAGADMADGGAATGKMHRRVTVCKHRRMLIKSPGLDSDTR